MQAFFIWMSLAVVRFIIVSKAQIRWERISSEDITVLSSGLDYTIVHDRNTAANLVSSINVNTWAPGCGSPPAHGRFYITGDWDLIRYRQSFQGGASCWAILGSSERSLTGGTGLIPFNRNIDILIENTLNKGCWNIEIVRCDNEYCNFWHSMHGSGSKGSIYVQQRRDPSSERAGLGTGTSCGLPTYQYSQIEVGYIEAEFVPSNLNYFFAYTTGSNNGMQYLFSNGANQYYRFSLTDVERIEIINGDRESKATILPTDPYYPSNGIFNVEDLLKSIGTNVDGKGWGGIFYKHNGGDWSYWYNEFYIRIVSSSISLLPPVPATTPITLALDTDFLWAKTTGDGSSGIIYQTPNGKLEYFDFDYENAQSIRIWNANENEEVVVSKGDIKFPLSPFRIETVLSQYGFNVNGRGIGGIFYRSFSASGSSDWDHWVNNYYIRISS